MPTLDLHLPPHTHSTWARKRPTDAAPPLIAGLVLVARWIERARQRRALASLSDHELRDIGITRAEALRETEKPFWK